MTALDQTELGQSGVAVPRICFGSTSLADMPDTYGYAVGEDLARQTLNAIFDGPVNFLDTARMYAGGRSEELIGKVIRERGGLPEGFVISTKLDRNIETTRFDAARARESFEQSLEALGLDRVSVLHLHDPEHCDTLDEITGPNGSIAELFKIKEEGLADAVGLAAGRVDVMMPMLRDWDFDVLITHNRYTLNNRNAEDMIAFTVERGISVINAAPFGSGVLAKGTKAYPRFAYQLASDDVLEPIRKIEAVCEKYDVPIAAAALQFSLRDSRIASTIVGMSRPERVQQTLDLANQAIPDEAWRELLALPVSTDDPEATRDYKPE